MLAALQVLLALFRAVPAIKALWEQFYVLYFNSQIDAMEKQNMEAIKKAINEYDQRELEKLISKRPGEVSNLPGTELRAPRVRDPESNTEGN